MPDLTPESARAIVDVWERARAVTADAHPLGMSPGEQLVAEASALGLTEDGFDWTSWEPYETGRIADAAFIADADVTTLRRIATAHFRLERFVGGHLAQMEEAGVLDAVVARLRALVDAGEV